MNILIIGDKAMQTPYSGYTAQSDCKKFVSFAISFGIAITHLVSWLST